MPWRAGARPLKLPFRGLHAGVVTRFSFCSSFGRRAKGVRFDRGNLPMSNVSADAGHREIIFHDDEETPLSALSTDLPFDARWFKCRRPFIITGGELTLDMLDLSFNQFSKVYDAPFQLKANNGIYLIDDFGRQRG